MSERQKYLGIAAGLIFIGSAVYWAISVEQPVTSRTAFDVRLKCRSCDADFPTTLQVSDQPPYVCKECKQRAAWRLKMCRKCNHIFMPEPTGHPPRQPMIPACPKCKSTYVGSAPVSP